MPPPTNVQMTPDGAQADVPADEPQTGDYERIEIIIEDGGAFTVNCYHTGSDEPETIEAANLQELVPILASKLGAGGPPAGAAAGRPVPVPVPVQRPVPVPVPVRPGMGAVTVPRPMGPPRPMR
jgi:hypothetical protein